MNFFNFSNLKGIIWTPNLWKRPKKKGKKTIMLKIISQGAATNKLTKARENARLVWFQFCIWLVKGVARVFCRPMKEIVLIYCRDEMLKIVSSICDTILCLKAELTRSVESLLVLIKVMSSIYLYVPFGHSPFRRRNILCRPYPIREQYFGGI